MRDDFAAFILSNRRHDHIQTINALRKRGYTGKIFVVVDDKDPTLDLYKERYPDNLLIFSKDKVGERIDTGDNFSDDRSILWARNASFDLAKSAGLRYFVQLDDDYRWFAIRGEHQFLCMNLDSIFEAFVDFLSIPSITTVAMSQGGDQIGGFDGRIRLKRKAMNSFFCDVEKPFEFRGRFNDDVNTYVEGGRRGMLFFTLSNVQLDHLPTQQMAGGMTGAYKDFGTYVKSFYSVMYAPSCVTIGMMGDHYKRLHHQVAWNAAVPKIVRQAFQKGAR